MEPLFLITLCLGLALLFAEIFNHFKISIIVGYILTGVIINFIPNIKPSGEPYITFLSNLGVVFLLFITGLEVNLTDLRRSSLDEILISIFSLAVPFALTFALMIGLDYNTTVAFIVAAAISITSEGTKQVILMELNKLKTKLGTIMTGAALLNDAIGVIFLSMITYVASKGLQTDKVIEGLQFLPIRIILFTVIIVILFKLVLPRIIKYMFKQHSQISSLMFIIVIFFVLASLSSEFSLSPLIGAFIAGVIIQLLIKTPQIKKRIIQQVKHFAFAIVIPFFFIEIGMNLDILSLGEKSILPILFFLILIFAIFGKLLGTLIVKPFSRLSFRQLNFVGWGMNARGAIELVLAEIAFDHNLIDKALYSIIVLVVIITTFILPFILNYFIKRYPGMMNNVHNYKRNSRNRISNLNKS